MDALHDETAGHPFLTANVLVELVDWLIEKKRPQGDLRLQEGDLAEFTREKLSATKILLSPEYDFFRQAAAAALSEQGYRDNPWLFEVYWVLRELSSAGPSSFKVSRADFQEAAESDTDPEGGMSTGLFRAAADRLPGELPVP